MVKSPVSFDLSEETGWRNHDHALIPYQLIYRFFFVQRLFLSLGDFGSGNG